MELYCGILQYVFQVWLLMNAYTVYQRLILKNVSN